MAEGRPSGERPEATPAEALLSATNRFIGAADARDLAQVVVQTATAIFGASKASLVLFGEDAGRWLAASVGYSDEEVGHIRAALAGGTPFVERAGRGGEWWSEDAGPLREEGLARLARYAARSGFSLPVRSPDGIRGVIAVLFEGERTFDAGTRETARSLAAQVGLAVRMLQARDDQRAKSAELERQSAVLRALFDAGQRLASVTSLADVPTALARAMRATTGASVALVGRWDAAAGRVRFVAAEGVPPEVLGRLAALELQPDRYAMIRGGLEGRAAVRRAPFDPDDLPADIAVALGLTAVAGAPIVVDDQTWGLIAVATRAGDPSIVETGAQSLAGLAAIAASAVGRAEAVAALEREADLLESRIAERTVQLRQAVDELLVANRAKTEFLANVSHELRTPLTAILGFSDVLLTGLDGPLTQIQRDDLETIDRSGRHLLALIDDLIDVSRIDAGRLELRPEPLDPARLIAGVVEEIRPLASAKRLDLRPVIRGLPDRLTADPFRIREILINLLSNAVKFTPAGGTVRLTATVERTTIRVVVEDTGIGIAPEHLERIFDKFHRVAGPEYPGTGLGLAIAREYAERHGGSLTVESALGLGSRFTVRLPLGGPTVDAEQRPAPPSPPGPSAT